MEKRKILILTLSFIAFGCSSSLQQRKTPHEETKDRKVVTSTSPRRMRLHYDESLAKAGFPSPVVEATVGGKKAWFLIDTGAATHVITSWFVNSAGLKTSDDLKTGDDTVTATASDATGKKVAFSFVSNITIVIEEWGNLDIPTILVVNFPPDFKDANIAGILSPQLLADADKSVVLDLRTPEMYIERFDVAVRRLEAKAMGTSENPLRPIGTRETPVPNLVFVIPVKVGNNDALLILDSGANRTKIAEDRPVGKAFAAGAESKGRKEMGIGGGTHNVKEISGVEIRLGDYSKKLDINLGKSAKGPGIDGILGLDFIRDCAFIMSDKKMAQVCGTKP